MTMKMEKEGEEKPKTPVKEKATRFTTTNIFIIMMLNSTQMVFRDRQQRV